MWRLFLLLTVVPAVELFLLLQLGALLGPWQTFAVIVITGFAGAWLAKREGLGVLADLRAELQSGLPPGSRIAEGVLVLAGGLLLVTPGVLTDLMGFAMIFPPTRRWLAPRAVRYVASRFDVATLGPEVRSERGGASPQPQHETPFANPFDDLP